MELETKRLLWQIVPTVLGLCFVSLGTIMTSAVQKQNSERDRRERQVKDTHLQSSIDNISNRLDIEDPEFKKKYALGYAVLTLDGDTHVVLHREFMPKAPAHIDWNMVTMSLSDGGRMINIKVPDFVVEGDFEGKPHRIQASTGLIGLGNQNGKYQVLFTNRRPFGFQIKGEVVRASPENPMIVIGFRDLPQAERDKL